MRVALKLVVVMVLILATVRLVEGMLTIQRETARLSADVERDARLMDRVLRGFMGELWELAGPRQAVAMLGSVNVSDHPVQLTWVPHGPDGLEAQLDAASIERLAAGEAVIVGEPGHPADQNHHIYTPIGDAGAVRTTEALDERSRYLVRSRLRELVAGGLVVFCGGAAIVFWGFVSVGKPLRRLEQRVDEIGRGDLDTPLDARGRDELASLARGLNTMCERLATSYRREREATEHRIAAIEQMRHADRLTTIGRLASGIAHELGTPLNVVSGRAEMIARGGLSPEQTRDYAQTIDAQAARMTGIIRHLLDFARQRQARRAPTAVMPMIDQTLGLVTSLGHKGQVRVEADDQAASLRPAMDANQMQQVLINLIQNALQAMPGGGEVVIGVCAVDAEPPAGVDVAAGRFVRLDVRDTGVGIPANDLEQLFDPFFTTKEVGQGTGLGLSVSHGIVSEHGGWISVSSRVGEGSCFSVYLPTSEAA